MRRRIEATQVVESGSAIDLAEAGKRYIAHLETVLERKPTTIQDYRIILERHLVSYFGERSLASIDPDSVAGYLRTKRRQGAASNTVRNQLNFLHGLFGFALKRRWVVENPVAAVDRPSLNATNLDIRYVTAAQVDSLLAVVPDDPRGPTDRVLYMAATMCGLRQGELVALRWRDDLVFCHPESGSPYDPSKMRRRFKAAISSGEIGQFDEVELPGGKTKRVPLTRFHDLRHTYGTRMAAAGTPLRNIQEWMGHSDYKTTSIYADFAPDPTQDAGWAEAAFGDSGSGGDDAGEDEDADSTRD